ncbi:methyl-accepting chemotaxis protein [Bradyrhizobium sp. CCBAU 45384]|uniref:methyl-accepting chemotaxis protein n=1 Tax=Bradyrhizobium sp. CCBAU 45384 TaxID=858428 RepID=UPI002306AECB|nr:methyl-accepting chemotaxis protein [Bradyrhizobium sp. CCBAU 45384]MDA9406385.1 chemotaxis protein [Bradyrhizobium sp. CCBAU 45384]
MFARLKLRIRGRLVAGFFVVCTIFVLSVAVTLVSVTAVSITVNQMVSSRTPAAIASSELVSNIHATLSALRGYLLNGNSQAKLDRLAMWKKMDAMVVAFDELSKDFAGSETRDKWTDAKTLISEFHAAQEKAEAVAFTADAYPATKLMTTEADPRADSIFSETTRMIDEEGGLEATPERKQLLKALADTRGNFAAAISLLRTYLMTGKKQDKQKCFKPWELFERGLADVTAQASLLTPRQRESFDKVTKAAQEFSSLFERIFALRDSPGWNLPADILASEAAPRALKILDLLDGTTGEDGARSGGIKTVQMGLLADGGHEVEAGLRLLRVTLWGLLVAGVALGIVIAFLTARAIATPIQGMTAAMGRLAAHDTSTTVPGIGRPDEIGEMADAVEVFKRGMIEADQLRTEQAESEARALHQRRTELLQLASRFESAVGDIVHTLFSSSTDLEAAANALSNTAETTQRLSAQVSIASGEASSNVQSVACATEEMSSSVTEISRQVQEAALIASGAVRQAHQTNDRVNALSAAATRIGDVVALINNIAGQTNLLALNATIEAARAGAAGRGFAVVASEVKALAEQTARATGEIANQIDDIQSATQKSVSAIRDIGLTIGRLSEISSAIASAVEEQGAATQEISRNIQHAAQGTEQVASSIVDVQRGANKTGEASGQLLASARVLSSDSSRLRTEVEKFLQSVRAA